MTATAEDKQRVMAYIESNPGCQWRSVYVHNHLRMTVAAEILGGLVEEGRVRKDKSKNRYYPVPTENGPLGLAAVEAPSLRAVAPADGGGEAGYDLESLAKAASALADVSTGTEADAHIRAAVSVLERLIGEAVAQCPFCGGDARLAESQGRYRIECDCGMLFAYSKRPSSMSETVAAFNRRATE